MKTTRLHRLSLVIRHWSFVISAAVASTVVATAADDTALRPIAFQNGVNQQSLGAETAEIARTINGLIDELQRNGFPVQSLSGLTELAAQLNTLGGTEMTAIATRLRRLGENSRSDPRATAAEAYLAQQAIETRLKTLARQLSIQQLREEAARRLEALITRQLAIQRETRAIATAKANAERQRLLESDQSGIGEDLATFFQTGENLLARLRENDAAATKSATTPAAAAGPTFSERINGPYLTTLSTEAVDHLKGKRYPDAHGRQETLITELRKILQSILSSLPKEQRLASALQQVAALRQQEAARTETKTATPESKLAAADQAQNLANQVAPLSPEAAAALQQAAKESLQNQPGAQPPQSPSPSAQTSTPPGQKPGNESPKGKPGEQQQKPKSQPQNKPGQQPSMPDQPQEPSAASKSLAAAEAALQKALDQAQNQAANDPKQPGQEKNAQPQAGQNQPQGPTQQGTQLGRDGKAPNPDQQGSTGNAQEQIAGHGPDSGDPAQVVGALRREEREAFTALQNERYPAEYSAWVQQYWRNLAQDQ